MKAILIALFFFLSYHTFGQTYQKIELNKEYSNVNLAGKNNLNYTFRLEKGVEYKISVLQIGIDAVLVLSDNFNNKILEKDSPNGQSGYEDFDFTPKESNNFKLTIKRNEDGSNTNEGKITLLVKQHTKADLLEIAKNKQKEIQDLWSFLSSVKPIDENSASWNLVNTKSLDKQVCISGNCVTGYGISVHNDRGFSTAYQYEGYFVDGKRVKGVYSTREGGKVAAGDDVNITKTGSFYRLARPSGRGFTLAQINYFQNLVCANLMVCKKLIPTSKHSVTSTYFQQNNLVDVYGGIAGHTYEKKSRNDYVQGLLNPTNQNLYIRAYSKGGMNSLSKDTPIEYFDESFVVESGGTMSQANFNLIPIDNGEKLTIGELEVMGYRLTGEQLRLKGYEPYIRFVGQYFLK